MPSDSGLFQGLPEVLLFPFCLKELYAGWRVSILEEIATHLYSATVIVSELGLVRISLPESSFLP